MPDHTSSDNAQSRQLAALRQLSADDQARLDTWNIEIAEALCGAGRPDGDGFRFGSNRALVVHYNARWHDFSDGESGHGTLSLLIHLHRGDQSAALAVAQAWLAGHAGDGRNGRSDGSDDDEDDAEAIIQLAEDDAWHNAQINALWERGTAINGTPAEVYLARRKLWPLPGKAAEQFRWIPNFRGDEGAILTRIAGNYGELVALQLLFLTPDGMKSPVQPVRITYRGPRDWMKGRGGAFRAGASNSPDIVLTEGVEDALSALMIGAPYVHASLGAYALGRAELLATVKQVIVCRDDDPSGSAACLMLGRGIARLLGQGVAVKVTARAGQLQLGAKDINDLLQSDGALARRLLDEAGALYLRNRLDRVEIDAILDGISRLPRADYEIYRGHIAQELSWRVGALDDDRAGRRAARAKAGGSDDSATIVGVPLWPDPVPELAPVLNAGVEQLKRFLVVPHPAYYYVIMLWCAHTHAMAHDALEVEYTPRLAFQSPTKECGKSTGLECASWMSSSAIITSSLTPSSLFRAVDALKISLFVDEADNVFKGDQPELLAIMNSGTDKARAHVIRSVKDDDDGEPRMRSFNTFAAVGLTSIDKLPPTLQSRSLVLTLRRATKAEKPEHLRRRTRGRLIEIGQQIARWAADREALPEYVPQSELFNRVEDKWEVLFRLAAAAGEDWPEWCRKGVLVDLAYLEEESATDQNTDLLADVWLAFNRARAPRLTTKTLCFALTDMEESPWASANNGKPVDGYYLKTQLRGFKQSGTPEEEKKWRRWGKEERGYHEDMFAESFDRYLGRPKPSTAPMEDNQRDTLSPKQAKPSAASAASAAKSENGGAAKTYHAADLAPASAAASAANGDGGANRHVAADAAADDTTTSAAKNHQGNQSTTAKAADAADAADSFAHSGKGSMPAPPPVDLPKGASGRRRRQPKVEH